MNAFIAIAAVAAGGAVGSVMRYLVSNWFTARLGPDFPWGTLTINVSGSFLIGIVLQLAAARAGLNPYVRLFLATGILGGYTTFSTFAYEAYILGAGNLALQSLGYAAGSVLAGVAAAYFGVIVVRAILP